MSNKDAIKNSVVGSKEAFIYKTCKLKILKKPEFQWIHSKKKVKWY